DQPAQDRGGSQGNQGPGARRRGPEEGAGTPGRGGACFLGEPDQRIRVTVRSDAQGNREGGQGGKDRPADYGARKISRRTTSWTGQRRRRQRGDSSFFAMRKMMNPPFAFSGSDRRVKGECRSRGVGRLFVSRVLHSVSFPREQGWALPVDDGLRGCARDARRRRARLRTGGVPEPSSGV